MITDIFKSFREQHGWNQTEFGVRLGLGSDVAQSRISHYETGRRDMPRHVAYAFLDLAEEMGETYSLDDLYCRPLRVG